MATSSSSQTAPVSSPGATLAAPMAAQLIASSPVSVRKTYHNAIPNSTVILATGEVVRFIGHTLTTERKDLQEFLDPIIGKAGITLGSEDAATELMSDAAQAAAQVSAQAQADTAAQAKELAARLAGGGSPIPN
jgi:hypothetical protein